MMADTLTVTRAWDWRKGIGGVRPRPDRGRPYEQRRFHAYDVNNNAACDIGVGLFGSVEEPNEGSELCPECIEIVRAMPEGREKRTYRPSAGED